MKFLIFTTLICVVFGGILDTGDNDLYNRIGGDHPALILFYVEKDCINCDRYHKAFEKLAGMLEKTQSSVVLGQVDFLRNPNTREVFEKKFESIPAIAFFAPTSTEPIEYFGELSAETIQNWLNTQLSKRSVPVVAKRDRRIKTGKGTLKGLSVFQTIVLMVFACIGIGLVILFVSQSQAFRHTRHTRID